MEREDKTWIVWGVWICTSDELYRRASHNVVAIETSAIGWPPWLIPFWYLWIWRNHVIASCMSMYNCSEINSYQNVINEGGHPIALVSMVTTLCEKSLYSVCLCERVLFGVWARWDMRQTTCFFFFWFHKNIRLLVLRERSKIKRWPNKNTVNQTTCVYAIQNRYRNFVNSINVGAYSLSYVHWVSKHWMGPLRIRHLARTKQNALGGKGFGGNILSHMAGRSLPFQCFHSPVRFLFVSFPSHGNPPTSAAELDSDPDSPHLDQFSLLWWSAAVSTGPVSLTAQPSAPSWRSTTWKKREACRSRSCPWLLTGITEQGNGKLSTSFVGGFRGVADFVHGKMDGMHVWSTASSSTFEAFPCTRAFVFTLPWLFCILASQVFNFFSSDRHFSSDQFSFGSSWPFFFVFVFSLFLFCLPRNAFTFVLYYLAILAKHINISPWASDGMRVLSLCLQSSWHIRTCTRSRSWPFWKFWQNIGLHCDGALRSTMKVQRLPPSARRHARQDLVSIESVLF